MGAPFLFWRVFVLLLFGHGPQVPASSDMPEMILSSSLPSSAAAGYVHDERFRFGMKSCRTKGKKGARKRARRSSGRVKRSAGDLMRKEAAAVSRQRRFRRCSTAAEELSGLEW